MVSAQQLMEMSELLLYFVIFVQTIIIWVYLSYIWQAIYQVFGDIDVSGQEITPLWSRTLASPFQNLPGVDSTLLSAIPRKWKSSSSTRWQSTVTQQFGLGIHARNGTEQMTSCVHLCFTPCLLYNGFWLFFHLWVSAVQAVYKHANKLSSSIHHALCGLQKLGTTLQTYG